jgi:hypothetical protein
MGERWQLRDRICDVGVRRMIVRNVAVVEGGCHARMRLDVFKGPGKRVLR